MVHGLQLDLRLDHPLHYDASRTESDADEMKTERGVASITIDASREVMKAFKKMITENEETVPGRSGDENFNFEQSIGTAIYLPSLYISTTQQNNIARQIHRDYLDLMRKTGFLKNDMEIPWVCIGLILRNWLKRYPCALEGE